MKRLLAVIILGVLAWSGFWIWSQQSAQRDWARWFEARNQQGWIADYGALRTRGFPNRLDTRITAPVLAAPRTGLAWSAPFLEVVGLTTQPGHQIYAFPDQQTVSVFDRQLDLHSTGLRASLTQDGSAVGTLVVEASRLQLGNVTLQDSVIGLRRTADQGSYAIAWTTPAATLGTPPPGLPAQISGLQIDGVVTLDRAIDQTFWDAPRPQPTAVHVKLAKATWGQIELNLAGRLDVDRDGYPNGQLMLKIRNWRDVLDLAVAQGIIPQGLHSSLTTMGALLASRAGSSKTLDVPLDFRGGAVLLGPVSVGRAPQLRLP